MEINSFSDVLEERDSNEDECESELETSGDQDFQLQNRGPTNSCFINNYFNTDLLAWEANTYIQQFLGCILNLQ